MRSFSCSKESVLDVLEELEVELELLVEEVDEEEVLLLSADDAESRLLCVDWLTDNTDIEITSFRFYDRTFM